MDEKNNEIILFENQGVKLEVNLKKKLYGSLKHKWKRYLMETRNDK